MQINSISCNRFNKQNFKGTLILPSTDDGDTLKINTDDITGITDKAAGLQCAWIFTLKRGHHVKVPIEKVLSAYTAASQKPNVTIELRPSI